MKLRDVTLSMAGTGRRTSNQAAVWADIDGKMQRLNAHSSTSAMSDIFEQHAEALEDYVRPFQAAPNQIGAAFAMAGRVMGLDLFDNPGSFGKLFPKLVRSYALDAIDYSTKEGREEGQSGPDFLKAIVSAGYETFKAIGEGNDLRFSNEKICGAALYARDRIVHLTAFALQ